MKRRNFVRSLVAAPIAPALLDAAQTVQNKTPAQQTTSQAASPAQQTPRQSAGAPFLKVTEVDLAGQPAPHYFNQTQFATLRKLSAVLMPPLKNNPGAIDAGAPEFLDFLISVSPNDRQALYLNGLDKLEGQAQDKFQRSFGELDARDFDAIIRPLLTARPWEQDFPSDPLKHFVAQVHEDLRAATMNSREWAEASEKSGRRFSRGFRSSGYYWAPIDPISEG